MSEHVAGQQRFFACAVLKDRHLGGAAAGPGSDPPRVVHRQFASGQTRGHAGQDVAHSAARHSRIAGGVVTDRFPALAHDGTTSFEEQRNRKLIAKIPRDSGARHFADFHQSSHLAGMRREQPRAAAAAQDVDLIGNNVQSIRVHDHRLWRDLD